MTRHTVLRSMILFAVTHLLLSTAFASEPAQQEYVARWTDTPPTIDGALDAEEYREAIPLHVILDDPLTPPGIVPEGTRYALIPPDDSNDLSFTIYALYDDENLYIAVDVVDDIVINDGPMYMGQEVTWNDDDAEVFIDGDGVGNDCQMGRASASKEGFQLAMDVGGDTGGVSPPKVPEFWEGAPGLRPDGYVVEFRISLSWIDMIDGEGEAFPGPGSSVGFNITVGDDDNGGEGYNMGTGVVEPTDSYGAWDGNSTGWHAQREDDWGTLYFEPPATSVAPSMWGHIKSLLRTLDRSPTH